MADREVGSPFGYASRSRTSDQKVGPAWPVIPISILDMRTRLAAGNAAYYTAARLNEMSANDMLYALRLMDAPGTI